jgi:beta-glucosidase
MNYAKMRGLTAWALAFLCAPALFSANASAQNPASAQDAASAQKYDQRARDIVRQMTLDEKIQELHGIRDDSHYRYVPGVSRLGIPPFRITNGPAGAGPGDVTKTHPQDPATALPSPIALAATWDVNLAKQYGSIVGEESKDIGNALVEAPDINIARLPQNGRTFEGYGEDPFLVGQMSASNIQGIQSQGVIANVKHYVANNQETDRFTTDEQIDERTLREIYLPGFEASIHQGQSASVMCAYPRVNGTFNCENGLLMNDILKKEWGFDGFITSDFGAVHSTVPSAMAGLDLEMPTGKYFGDDLKAAVESGQVPVSVIDDKLVRRFRTMMRFGVFDHPPVPKPIPAQENGAKSRAIAEQGMVLLKNQGGILPFARIKSIAVIGPGAMAAVTGGGGSSHVVPLYTVDPVEGIRKRAGAAVTVNSSDGSDLAKAAALAHGADVAIVMVSKVDREGRDQTLNLEQNQDELVEAVAGANPRTIVVLKTGSAVLMPWIEKVPAILEAWYPGEEDGNAVADVLFGTVNPSGKLPLTFPRRIEDPPASTPAQYPGVDGVAHYSEGIFVGYRHYDQKNIEPLFAFGYGLSYTTFAYSNLKVAATPDKQGRWSVDFDLHNSGHVAGAEVAQLYVGLPSTAVPQPPKQLKRFQKVFLAPGKTQHVHWTLDAPALSYWNVQQHKWTVAPGAYKVMVGASSRDIRLNGEFKSGVSAAQGGGK